MLDPLALPEALLFEPIEKLKERKLNREIVTDKNAEHRCDAVNFNLDISKESFASAEFSLTRNTDNIEAETIEIGSLPRGIDMIFLDNNDYSYSPDRDENSLVLQVENQVGSQQGNFNVPIIYTIGNSTIICQINIINLSNPIPMTEPETIKTETKINDIPDPVEEFLPLDEEPTPETPEEGPTIDEILDPLEKSETPDEGLTIDEILDPLAEPEAIVEIIPEPVEEPLPPDEESIPEALKEEPVVDEI